MSRYYFCTFDRWLAIGTLVLVVGSAYALISIFLNEVAGLWMF